MKNFVQKGNVIHKVLGDTVKGGDVVITNNVIGIAVTDGDGVNLNAVQTKGVFRLPKDTTVPIAQGKKVYWDGTKCVALATGSTLIGDAWNEAATADDELEVKL